MMSIDELKERQKVLRKLIEKAARQRDFEAVEVYGESLASVEEQIARWREAN